MIPPSTARGKELIFSPKAPENLSPSYLLSTGFDGEREVAFVKLYEPKSKKVYFWYDTSGHHPYCLCDASEAKLRRVSRLMSHPGLLGFERVRKYDGLNEKWVALTKVVAKDPLSIGGRRGCIRDILEGEGIDVWEARIRYHQSYIFDQDLAIGMPYKIENGKLVATVQRLPEKVARDLQKLSEGERPEIREYIMKWATLFECPFPRFRRVALDIEVYTPTPGHMPSTEEAKHPIICVSLIASDGARRVLLLERPNVPEGGERLPSGVEIERYKDERELIKEVFRVLLDYPFVITFNGDDFDFPYLLNRALRLGFKRSEIPIMVSRRGERGRALLSYGIHLDLYRLFFNKALQVYAFKGVYREVTLDEIGRTILGIAKFDVRKTVSELSYRELARYCFRDAEITYGLTAYDDELVMKLVTVLARVTRLPIEDLIMLGVSRWILNIMRYEHRSRNMLIPRSEDVLEAKGKATTEAIIKGKKYKGAIVVEPKPGIHFDVSVLDFSSLYPSAIKRWGLSYEAINCKHKECKEDKVPGTSHWICRRRYGITSLVIGSLRDLRVKWYKLKSKDKSVPKEQRDWYTVIQMSLKVILNAGYGVFGSDKFPLYCPPVAECATAIGRYLITQTIKKAESAGIDVIYGDSVHGDRNTVYLDADGLVKIQPIKVLFDKLARKHGIKKIRGHEYVFTKKNVKVLCVSSDGDAKFEAIKYIKRHAYKGYLLKIRTLRGETLVTPSHSVFSENGGSLESIPARNCKGIFIAHVEKTKPIEIVNEVNLLNEAMDSLYLYVPRHGNSHLLKYHHAYHTVKHGRYIAEKFIRIPLQLAQSLYKKGVISQEALAKSKIGTYNRVRYPVIIPLTPDLAWVMGLYVAEGHAGHYVNQVSREEKHTVQVCNSQNYEMLERVRGVLDKYLGTHPSIFVGDKRSDTYRIVLSNRVAYHLFVNILKAGGRSINKRIPPQILSASIAVKLAFFDGYYCGNGTTKGDPRYRIAVRGFTSRSSSLIDDLMFLISQISPYLNPRGKPLLDYRGDKSTYRIRLVTKHRETKRLEDVRLLRPKRVEAVRYDGYVYDICANGSFVDARGLVLLHNTDSTFLERPSKQQIHDLIDWSRDSFKMDLDVDKVYRYVVFSMRKKNYVGVYSDGVVDIKGLTGKKRNIPLFMKKAFLDTMGVLSKIRSEEDFVNAKSEIERIVNNCYSKLKRREYPIEELAFHVMLSKLPSKYTKSVPQHVKVANQLIRRGNEVKAGDIMSFVKVKGREGVKAIQLARVDDIDTKKYVELMRSVFEQILDPLVINFDEMIGIKTLDAFLTGD